MAEKDFKADVIEFFNSEFAGDLSKLTSAEIVLKKLEITGREIKSEPGPPKIKVSEIDKFTKRAEEALAKIADLQKKQQSLQEESIQQIAGTKVQRDHFKGRLKAVKELENAHNYLLWLNLIETTNESMEEAILQGNMSEIVAHFLYFKTVWQTLKGTECRNFLKYLEDILQYWHDVLKDKFGNEFQKLLPSLHWPVTPTSATQSTKQDSKRKFKELFNTLCDIQLPNDFRRSSKEVKTASEHGTVILPLQLMFEPLQKRFLFHFLGNKQTNRVDKPEWYLAQVLTWISDHVFLLNDTVQPILETRQLKSVFAVEELMRFLVQLAIKRLRNDMPLLLANDCYLSHTVDEIFLFEKELQSQGYPRFFPSLLDVLKEEPCFSSWKSLEYKSAMQKMDTILNAETAWKSRYQDETEELDELRVPECAEMFVTLLLSITERYRHLSNEKLQLSFVELQLDLLDDFRLRLHQLSQLQMERTHDPKFVAILNTVHYTIMVLNEWSNFPLYLKLYTFSKQSAEEKVTNFSKKSKGTLCTIEEEELNGSLFDSAISLLEHMQRDLLDILGMHVLMEIKAKHRDYRNEKWFCMPIVHDKKSLELSPNAYPLLDTINSSLQKLQELLAKPLFTTTWQHIARELDLFLYEEVILQNSFNEGGAEQINYDLTRNLFPIFGQYSLKPENYFRLVKESCCLLSLSAGPAILLKETLMQQNETFKDRRGSLSELGINNLTPSQALVILQQRNDLSS